MDGSRAATARTPTSRDPPPARPPARFDTSDPANQRKLEAAEQLTQLADDAGNSLIEMAIAFVLRHPAVTAAIIDPRTMAHLDVLDSQLAAADVELSTDLLDRIDQINPPGVTINPADNGWVSPAMEPAGPPTLNPSPRERITIMKPARSCSRTTTPAAPSPRAATSPTANTPPPQALAADHYTGAHAIAPDNSRSNPRKP